MRTLLTSAEDRWRGLISRVIGGLVHVANASDETVVREVSQAVGHPVGIDTARSAIAARRRLSRAARNDYWYAQGLRASSKAATDARIEHKAAWDAWSTILDHLAGGKTEHDSQENR